MTKPQMFMCFFFCLLLALIPVLSVVAQRSAGFIPGLAGLLGCLSLCLAFKTRPVLPRAVIYGIAAICGLALASALWSFDPPHIWKMPVRASLVMGSGLLLLAAANTYDLRGLRPFLWLIPAALLIAAILIVFDQKNGNPLYRGVRDLAAGEHVQRSQYNRASSIIVLMLLPSLYILRGYCGRWMVAGLTALCIGPLLLVTDSQSGQMALALALLTYLVFPYARPKAWYALAGLLFILALAAPFLSIWVFNNFAADIESVPMLGTGGAYAGARLEIWDYVSRYMLQRPLNGFGFEATRFVPHFESAEVYQKTSIILHPHNFMIQIWMEFGVIGALLTGGLMAGLILWLQKRLTVTEARIALPSIIACLSIASTGYGLWQAWWIGTLFTVATVCLLAIRLETDKLTTPAPLTQ